MAMHDCDVLLAVGARFDDRVTGDVKKFCPHARIVHIDIDPSSIGKNVPVDVPIVGSVPNVLRELIKQIKASNKEVDKAALDAWWAQINEWRGAATAWATTATAS